MASLPSLARAAAPDVDGAATCTGRGEGIVVRAQVAVVRCPVHLIKHGASGLAGGQAGAPPVPMRSFTCMRPQEVLR